MTSVLHVVLAIALVGASSSVARSEPSAADLSYYADKRIYVTFSALWDMKDCLSKAAFVAQENAASDGRKLAIKLLREFVNSKLRDGKMNKSPAFLLIDFGSPRASFKLTSETSGTTTTMETWKQSIPEIAQLVALLLDGQWRADQQIVRGPVDVAAAWAELTIAKDDPYISTERYQVLGGKLALHVRTDEGKRKLNRLGDALADEIKDFTKRLPRDDLNRLDDDLDKLDPDIPFDPSRVRVPKGGTWKDTFDDRVPSRHEDTP